MPEDRLQIEAEIAAALRLKAAQCADWDAETAETFEEAAELVKSGLYAQLLADHT